jgi:hypothetical protein
LSQSLIEAHQVFDLVSIHDDVWWYQLMLLLSIKRGALKAEFPSDRGCLCCLYTLEDPLKRLGIRAAVPPLGGP